MSSRRIYAGVIACALAIVGWLSVVAATVTKASFWRSRHSKHHDKLLEMYKHLHACMEEVGIAYWICAGTLLGAVRNGGFIPWDDDIDLGMDSGQFCSAEVLDSKMTKLQDLLFQRHQLILKPSFGVGWQVYSSARPVDDAHIDLFYFRKSKKYPDRMEHVSDYAREMWPSDWILTSDLFPLRNDLYTFEGMVVPTPARPVNNLHHYYGPNCLAQTRVTHLHACGSLSEVMLTYGIEVLNFLGIDMCVDMNK